MYLVRRRIGRRGLGSAMNESSTIRPDAIELPPTVPIDVMAWLRSSDDND